MTSGKSSSLRFNMDNPSFSAPPVYVRPPKRLEYLNTLSPASRNNDRTSLVRSLIESSKLEDMCQVVEARKATMEELALAHSHRYLELLMTTDRWLFSDSERRYDNHDEDSDTEPLGTLDGCSSEQLEDAGLVDECPAFPGMWEMARYTVGGAVTAAEHLVQGQNSVACWFEGGRHHAASDSAQGFCYGTNMRSRWYTSRNCRPRY